MNIIRDLRYIGTVVNGMYAVNGFGSRRCHKTPESEWYVSENMHEPIVSKETYENAQLCVRKISKGASRSQSRVPSPYTFPVKIRCGGCGHALVKNGAKVMAYYCRYRNTYASEKCFTGRIEVETLKELLLTSIQCLYNAFFEQKKAVSIENAPSSVDVLKQIRSLQREIDGVSNSKLTFYTRYRDDEISREEYISQRNLADERIQELSAQMNLLEQTTNLQEHENVPNSPVCEILKGIPYPNQYSNELKTAFNRIQRE